MPYETLSQDSPEAQSPDLAKSNLDALSQLFPSVVRDGQVDVDALRQLVGEAVDEKKELYGLNWHGKREARAAALTPSLGTLRPCKEDSVDWDTTKNLYIEGDNLEVLKLLQKSYAGKVKMIYIDPPYNTGKDFIYRDDYKENLEKYKDITNQTVAYKANLESTGRFHTNWLNMMYPRLMLAKSMLRDDGVIFISIDEREILSLRCICNEIFGEENYAGEIIWKNSSKNDQDYISIQHEYMLVYVRNKFINKGDWYVPKEKTDVIFAAFDKFYKKFGDDWESIHRAANEWYKEFPPSDPLYDNKHYSWMDERGIYFPSDIAGPNHGQYVYDVVHPITGKVCKAPKSGWRYPESTMKDRISQGLVHFGIDETTVPKNKTYLKDTLMQSLPSVKYLDGRAATKRLTALMGGNYFTNPKDENFLADLMKSVNVKDSDIVIDFFAGSSTTAHSIIKLNREMNSSCRFIMVQLPENLHALLSNATGSAKQVLISAIDHLTEQGKPHVLTEIGKERILLAGMKEKEEAGLDGMNLDIGFRVYKLDTSNVKPWNPQPQDLVDAFNSYGEHLIAGRTNDDFLAEIMLKSGIELTEKTEERIIAGHQVHSLGHGQYYACMDSNLAQDAEAVALGIAEWREDQMKDIGGVVTDIVTVFVLDKAFNELDAAKMNFVAILEQHGIGNIKAL